MRTTVQTVHSNQRARAESKVVLAAWLVGITVWLSGMASLALFF